MCIIRSRSVNALLSQNQLKKISVKKITLAALILAGFAASAQAQSNVTVYGLVDLGLAKTTGQTTIERENHASRLGFRGAEDLGSGLSTIFNLEMEILADTGLQKGNLFERQAWVGFKGSFGTVYFGRTKDLIDGAQGRVEPFGADGVIGKVNEPMMRGGVGASRVQNAITYNSVNMDGFVGSVQYVLSEISGAKSGISVLGTYDMGPVSAHVGYQKAVQTAVTTASQADLFTFGGAYKFGDFKMTGQYAKGDTKVAAKGKLSSVLLGGIYSVGATDYKAVISRQLTTTNTFSDRNTVREIGIGLDHHLSKRTDLYAYAGRERVAHLTSYQAGISHKF
jgi:predicted porin